MPISAEQCVSQLEDLLGQVPIDTYSEQALEWFADVAGTVGAYSVGEAIPLTVLMPSISDTHAGLRSPVFAGNRERACTQFKMHTRSLYRKLRLETNIFVTVQFEPGSVHDYFEEVRQLLSSATHDVLFIDPWINAEFAVRYLPQVPDGVVVRLLTARGQGVSLREALNLMQPSTAGTLSCEFTQTDICTTDTLSSTERTSTSQGHRLKTEHATLRRQSIR